MTVFQGIQQPEVVVITPAHFDEAIHAVRAVQQLRTVVLHLGAMPTHEAQRTIDFVSGGVCAVDGQAERLADSVFLFAPTGVAIQRDAAPACGGEPRGATTEPPLSSVPAAPDWPPGQRR